jgi:hypothetical protein
MPAKQNDGLVTPPRAAVSNARKRIIVVSDIRGSARFCSNYRRFAQKPFSLLPIDRLASVERTRQYCRYRILAARRILPA